MSALYWPTHRAKTHDRRKKQLAAKNRRQHVRRLTRGGKRAVIQENA